MIFFTNTLLRKTIRCRSPQTWNVAHLLENIGDPCVLYTNLYLTNFQLIETHSITIFIFFIWNRNVFINKHFEKN